MSELNIRNPKYCSAEQIKIDVTFDHPEFGEIPYTFDPTTEDESYDAEIREYIESIAEEDIQPFEPYVPTQYQLDQAELAEKYAYLVNTDWVVVKIQEASLLGEDTSSLTAQYQDIIDERRASRTRINELETALEGE